MTKHVWFLVIIGMVIGCAKPTRPMSPLPEAKKDSGYVLFVSGKGGGEWQLVDSEGRRLVPLNLSPALKVHRLRVYFHYEEVAKREDGVPLVRLVFIAIE
ncbi:MAG: hypothetical protein N2314_08090 [Brevinematales bacterium]|nr:hypothetical protein [Brevinematales bacterium]